MSVYLEQRWFIAMILIPVVYVFAGETANQWFYLICSGIVSSLLVGFFLPLMQVKDVQAQCTLPSSSVTDDSLLIRITIKRRARFGIFSQMMPIKWLLVRANLVSNVGKTSVLKPMLVEQAGDESWVFATTSPLHRGVYKLRGIELYSCFPLGLTWWSRTFDLKTADFQERPSITVYPKTVQVEGNFLYKIRAATESPMGLIRSRKPTVAVSSLVRGLREFMHGDSPRMVHWASSARSGKLLVREFEAEGLPGFDILLNLRANWVSRDQFELAVSIVHSLLTLGFKMGGSPDLIIIPNLDGDIRYLPTFMNDMPVLPHGMAKAAQLLARVEPLKQMKSGPNQEFSLEGTANQALMTIRPTTLADGETNRVVETVDMAVIPRTWEAASQQEGQDVEAHVPMHELGMVNRRQGSGKSAGRVIVTIKSLAEVAHL